jgi:hypothetical protein
MNCSGAVLKAEEESHQWQRLVVHGHATNFSLNEPSFQQEEEQNSHDQEA